MYGAVPRSGDAVLLTIRDDAQALPSRDRSRAGAPRILGAFQEPTEGSRIHPVLTDRTDAMRIRGQVADTGWSRIPGKHEEISVFARWCR
jgi:hypothetical protein